MLDIRQEIHEDLADSLSDSKTGLDRKTVRTVEVVITFPDDAAKGPHRAVERRIFYTDEIREEYVSIPSMTMTALNAALHGGS